MFDIYVPIAILVTLAFLVLWWWKMIRPRQSDTVVAVRRMIGGQYLNPPATVQVQNEPKGLSKEIIDSYPRVVIGESGRMLQHDDNTCPICLTEYLTKDTLKILPECLHRFHADCLDEWLSRNATCPVCRVQPPSLLAPHNV